MSQLRLFPVFLALTASAFAQTWTGTTSSDWSTGANWSTGSVPTGSVIINSNGTNAPVVGTANASVSNLTLGSTTNSTVLLGIQNGFRLSSGNTYVGNTSSANITLNVTGTNSTLAASSLYASYSGTGALNVTSGAKVTSSSGYIGFSANSNGTVTIDGTGSQWTDSGKLDIGGSSYFLDTTATGTGTFTISNGGKVTNTTGTLGYQSGALGTVNVTGTGSQWLSSGLLTIGSNGRGVLNISNGGTVTSTGARIWSLGSNATQSSASLTGTGSSWTNTGTLTILGYGGGAGATFTLGTGASFSSSGLITLGGGSASGAATITQTGGTLTASGGLTFGTGTTTYHLQGGTLQIGGTNGIQATGTYTFDLSGGTIQVTGSNLTTSVNATLANATTTTFDTNSLNATWSGVLSGSGSFTKSGTGTLTLSGNNTYSGTTGVNTGTLALGNDNALSTSTALHIGNSGTLAVGTSYAQAGSLSGSGAVTFNGGALTIGADNTDTAFSGSLSGPGTFGKVGTGTLTLSGTGAETSTIIAGGKVILANTSGQSAVGTNALSVGTTGTLAGTGLVSSSTSMIQGVLAPGDSTVGSLTFTNALTLANTAILQLNLASASSYDQLILGGTFTAGGTLSVDLLNGYTPTAGATFQLFDLTNPITGTFGTLNLATLDTGLSWDTSQLYSTGTLAVTTSAVPEPATYALLIGVATLGVVAVRRRKLSNRSQRT